MNLPADTVPLHQSDLVRSDREEWIVDRVNADGSLDLSQAPPHRVWRTNVPRWAVRLTMPWRGWPLVERGVAA